MHTFTDFYHNEVKLSFQKEPFSKEPKHVWVICRYKTNWLLTNHKERGIEFPGGKVEHGETAYRGAIREVMEETGGVIKDLTYIGQYYVAGKREHIIKNVYYANVKELLKNPSYYETKGPVLLEEIPLDVKSNPSFSFIMKDNILTYCLDFIKEHKN